MYVVKMQTIVIDEEFKSLLPKLDKETYVSLEANLVENGCRDPLVIWNDILVDGHNRYEICTQHDIPFSTVNKDFASREEALIWIITTQVSRRNLSPIQLSHYRGLHYRTERKIITNAGGKNQYSEVVSQNGEQPQTQSTVARLATRYRVSPRTIERDAKIAEAIDAIGEASPEAKQMILAGEASISKKDLEELSSRPKEEITAIAEEIEKGTYENKKTAASSRESPARPVDSILAGMRPLETIISKLSDGFNSDLPKITKKADRAQLKTALRAFIDRLEDLYGRI
jgi:hypothetical protein